MSRFLLFKKSETGFFLFCVLFLAGSLSAADPIISKTPEPFVLPAVRTAAEAGMQADKTKAPDAIRDIWDPNKYISLDEIRPGMDAYCLTEFGDAGIEKFDLEIIDVIRNIDLDRDAILVRGTDERFIHTGPVAGCSGSPVYIDGRLAGALAFAWFYSKDPLYGATPIAEMLKVGQGTQTKVGGSEQSAARCGFVFDFTKPIDFAEIDRQIKAPRLSRNDSFAGAIALPCPLITSGLPAKVREQLKAVVEPFGLMVVSGVAGGLKPETWSETHKAANDAQDAELVPGACLAVPLVSGDITMTVFGTATEVIDDKVYGFGHSFLGYGPVDLPMATGQVHTVVSTMVRSFKLASIAEIVGALTTDESMAVFGRIGAKAKLIPLTVRIDRYNDTQKRVYNCQVANNQLLTPSALTSAVSGAAFYLGDFPPDHMIEYKVAIDIENADSISFENVSTSLGVAEMIQESVGSVALLMNNPYKIVDIKSIDFDVRIVPKNIISHIWSVDLSDSKVKAGEKIEIAVVVESVLAGKKKYQCSLKIPEDLGPGKYDLAVSGSQGYEQFLKKAVPYRFIPQSLSGLIDSINNSLRIDRDKLYCLLVLPSRGVAVEKAELPDLPATKTLVLQNAKRTLKTQPYSHWLEISLETGTIVVDKKVMQITVEK